jgi:sulfate adenylyltransferase subunit 2
MADLIRCQDPSLDTLLLEPDGKYQTRTVTLDALMQETTGRLAEGFKNRRAEDFPMHYCAWGKCRVGSTPLNNLFGVAGLPSYYQPVKGILRHALVGSTSSPWIVAPTADHTHIFSKETAGPYVLAESLFNPLQCLVEAGYPPDRLHVIMLDRDPASSLASWLDKWSDRAPPSTLVYNYVTAALNACRVEGYAKRHGIPVTHYVYEASKEAVATVRNLFDRLGLASRFTEDTVTAWNEMGQLESESTRIIFSDVPPMHPTSGIHGSDTAYRYRARATGTLSDVHLNILERCGVYDAYRASVEACVHDLGLDTTMSERLFGGSVTGSSMADLPVIASPPLAGIPCDEQHHAISSHLQQLEAESIHILREVAAEFRKPVMLYSIGKDSSVLLHLAMKAFHPGKPPFPLLHVDTTWKFREMIAFRDQRARELGLDLLVHANADGVAQGIGPFSHGSALHTDVMKTQALRQALDLHGFDAAIGGARRDEEKSRAKERIFSHRSAAHRWDPKNQRPELWSLYNTLLGPGESMRVFPLSNWTELDVWEYILLENIPIVPLYLAAPRPVVERDGALIMVDDDRMPLRPGERPQLRSVRFRTLGCYPLTGATPSTAATLPEIVKEMMASRTSEREGRVIDRDSAGSMERKKVEGYF